MARGVNKVILVGNLGQDPEVRYLPSGNAVTNISVATTESWKDKQTGQQQDRTEWHRVVFFNRLAEIVGEYLKKGSQVYLEGKLQTRKWQDQSGQDRYSTEIVANEMQMLGGRQHSDMGSSGQSWSGNPQQPNKTGNQPPTSNGNNQPGTNQPPRQTTPASPGIDDFDDDIPF